MTWTQTTQENGVLVSTDGTLRIASTPYYKVADNGRALAITVFSNISDEDQLFDLVLPTREELKNYSYGTITESLQVTDSDGNILYDEPTYRPQTKLIFSTDTGSSFSGELKGRGSNFLSGNFGGWDWSPNQILDGVRYGPSVLVAGDSIALLSYAQTQSYDKYADLIGQGVPSESLLSSDSLDAIFIDDFGIPLFGEEGYVAQIIAQNSTSADISLLSPTEGSLEFDTAESGFTYSFVSDADLDVQQDGVEFEAVELSNGKSLYTLKSDVSTEDGSTSIEFTSQQRLSEENITAAFRDTVEVALNEELQFVEAPEDTEAPVITPDAYTVDEGGTIQGNVLSNDTDASAFSITAINGLGIDGNTTVTSPEGELSINPDGSLIFQAGLIEGGDAQQTFTYTATDSFGNSSQGEASITVTNLTDPDREAPVTTTDTYTVDENAALEGNVLSNDTDESEFSVTAINGIALVDGQVSLETEVGSASFSSDGSFSYRAGEINGVESILDGVTYTATDANGNSADGQASITVTNLGDFDYAPLNSWQPATRIEINPGGPAADVLGDELFQNDGRLFGLNNRTSDSTYGDITDAAFVLGADGSFSDGSIEGDAYVGTMPFSKGDGYRISADFNTAQLAPLDGELILDGALVSTTDGSVLATYESVLDRTPVEPEPLPQMPPVDPITGVGIEAETGTFERTYFRAETSVDKFNYKGESEFGDSIFVIKDSYDNVREDKLTGTNYALVFTESGTSVEDAFASEDFLMSDTFAVVEGQRTFVAIDGESIDEFKSLTDSDNYTAHLVDIDTMEAAMTRSLGDLSKETKGMFDGKLDQWGYNNPLLATASSDIA